MPDIRDAFYHGYRQQIRRVLTLLGPERTEKGLMAFEHGGSNWANCFFGLALAPQQLQGEWDVAKALGLPTVVPIRIVYQTFDHGDPNMTKASLRSFIEAVLDESRPQEVLSLLRSINYDLQQPVPEEACQT